MEILVNPGDEVEQETPLLVLETDKATLEVPAPQTGIVRELHVKVGDKISQGSLIVTLETKGADNRAVAPTLSTDAAGADMRPAAANTDKVPASVKTPAPVADRGEIHAEVVVLGAGWAAILQRFVLLIWVSRLY